jgi:hypothetical protein
MELEPTNRIKMGKKAFPIPSSTDFYAVFIADTLPTPTYLPINLIINQQGHHHSTGGFSSYFCDTTDTKSKSSS